ncbi:hypothetical protein PG989_014614 [Apiospora arundinis]
MTAVDSATATSKHLRNCRGASQYKMVLSARLGRRFDIRKGNSDLSRTPTQASLASLASSSTSEISDQSLPPAQRRLLLLDLPDRGLASVDGRLLRVRRGVFKLFDIMVAHHPKYSTLEEIILGGVHVIVREPCLCVERHGTTAERQSAGTRRMSRAGWSGSQKVASDRAVGQEEDMEFLALGVALLPSIF